MYVESERLMFLKYRILFIFLDRLKAVFAFCVINIFNNSHTKTYLILRQKHREHAQKAQTKPKQKLTKTS